MAQFRTLDWGMPALRRTVIHLDFVTKDSGPVIASSITYAGFVGVLTGVRKEFSTTVVEKDRITAKVRDSDDFVVVTNSDEQLTGASFGRQGEDGKKEKGTYGIAMAEIVEEAEDRKQCAECNCHNLRSELARRNGLYYPSSEQLRACLAIEDVVELVQK
ncbi:hypothetical protein B0A50_03595 [Salinomyces thailandicus]|uniref:ceramidase n=1 Tax=Salinomyces thailandicus TaxID=706561 RepID=A0A4U0U4V8_9PEZI|nr:hypothetical protein B0A50_03595 [Salinomyces thailandica]